MKMHRLLASAFLFILSPSCFAGWQVAAPATTIPREPFFQAGGPPRPVFIPPPASPTSVPMVPIGPPRPLYAISLCGSLKENLERILGRYHWRLIWKVPYDYNFDGKVTGGSLPNVIEKLLDPFPLQAVMYMSNRTVAIVPRLRT